MCNKDSFGCSLSNISIELVDYNLHGYKTKFFDPHKSKLQDASGTSHAFAEAFSGHSTV